MPKNKDYDKRIFRLLFILNKLDQGQKVSTRQLAEEFNVSTRTIQRDLEILNQTGFLLSSPQKGFYKFEEGFSLKKLNLTEEEASLLGFLYDISKSLGERFEETFSKILKKIIQEGYESPFYVKLPIGEKLKNFKFLPQLEEAIDLNKKIRFNYQRENQTKTFKLCPLKIIFYDGFWYLLTLLESKNWLLKFKLENIKDLEVLDEYFVPPQNLSTILEKSTTIWFSEKAKKKVLLKIDSEVAKYFKERIYLPEQKIKKEGKDSSLLIEAKVSDFMEVIPAVLSWIPYVEVIEPKELKIKIKDLITEYIEKSK